MGRVCVNKYNVSYRNVSAQSTNESWRLVRDEVDHMVKENGMLWNIITSEDNLEQETVIGNVLKLKGLYEKEYL